MEQKHSAFGIASICISIAVVISIIVMVWLYAAYANVVNHLPIPVPLNSLCLASSPVLLLAALGLGIGGLFQKNRRKDYSTAGIVVSVLFLAILVFIYILLAQS